MVFTNKHVIIAMIVAPVLAVLAWLAAGQFFGDPPRPAQPGQSYPLLEKSNCRYASGTCYLENEDFRLTLTLAGAGPVGELVVRSAHALEGVVLGVGLPEDDAPPRPMRAAGGQGLEWRLDLERVPAPQERIRLVALAGGSTYFGEVATTFLHTEERAAQ